MAGTVNDALMARESIAIREIIGTRVMNTLGLAGEFFDDMEVFDVGKADGFEVGRDGFIKKRFMGSVAGTVRGGSNFNHRALYGDKTAALGNAPFYVHSPQQTGPDPLNSPVPAPYGWTGELYTFEATVPLTAGQLQLEALPAVIKDQIAPIFDGFSTNMRQYVGVHFFTDREQANRLCTLGATGTGATQWAYDNTAGVKTLSFFPLERVYMRFIEGQELDLWDKSTGLRINEVGGARIPMWVLSVSHNTGRVVVQIDPSQDLTAAPWTNLLDNTTESLANGDYITWAGQNTGNGLTSPYGWHDWIKSGSLAGTAAKKRILGTAAITTTANDYIDVELRPFFQSWQQESVGTLTQQDLEIKLDEANLALRSRGHELDTGIMSRGVRSSMYLLDIARSYLTNARPAQQDNYGLKGAFVINTPSGGSLRCYVSPMIEDGEFLAVKWKGNWGVATVPSPQGFSSNSRMTPNSGLARAIPIEFKGRFWGYPTDKVPVFNGVAQHLDMVQFPCQAKYNLVPRTQVPGFRLTGITTTRAFSAPA